MKLRLMSVKEDNSYHINEFETEAYAQLRAKYYSSWDLGNTYYLIRHSAFENPILIYNYEHDAWSVPVKGDKLAFVKTILLIID